MWFIDHAHLTGLFKGQLGCAREGLVARLFLLGDIAVLYVVLFECNSACPFVG